MPSGPCLLVDAQIPAGPINTIEDALTDAQIEHLGLVERCLHPTLDELPLLSNPLAFDASRGNWIRRSPPLLGEHTCEVLAEFGFSETEISELERLGTVFQHRGDAIDASREAGRLKRDAKGDCKWGAYRRRFVTKSHRSSYPTKNA